MSSSDSKSNDQLEQIVAEFLASVRTGNSPDIEEVIKVHPELGDELRTRLSGYQATLNHGPIREDLTDAAIDGSAETLLPDGLASTYPPKIPSSERTRHGNDLVTEGLEGDTYTPQSLRKALRQFGDYQLLEEIARGGMGVVYKARQTKLNRIVALKMILSGQFASSADIQRFYTEAESAANLDHPGIVPVYEVGECEGQHYFSMGFVQGQSLKAKADEGPLSSRDAASLMLPIAEAVAYAHDHGVVHRDLKPANVLLDDDGHPRITDFGLAKRVESDSDLTATGQVLGTPAYMPPEQAAGRLDEVGPLSDLYSLGAILYYVLTGRPPFQTSNIMETLKQVLEKEPVSPRLLNPSVDRDLETICLKCLEKQAANRYASVQKLVDELNRFLSGEPIQARRIGTIERAWRWCRRKPLAAALCASVLVVVVAVGAAIMMARSASQSQQVTELNRQIEAGLDSPELTQQYLDHMDSVIAELAQHSSEKAEQAKQRLLKRFEEQISEKIRRPKLLEEDAQAISAAIDLLKSIDAAAADQLTQDLANRLGDWQIVFELQSPFQELSSVFSADTVQTSQDSLLRQRGEDGTAVRMALTNIESSGLVQIEAKFDANWEKLADLGVAVNAEDKQGYQFLLRLGAQVNAIDKLAATSFAGVRERGGAVEIVILRNDAPLVKQEISLQQIESGPLMLRATRERGKLSFQINTLPPVEFRDPFPLGSARPGKFAVRWPVGLAITELRGWRKPRPPAASTLEQGDEAFDRGEFSAALKLYKQQAVETEDIEFRQEARYKQGSCLVELNRIDEATQVFEPLLGEGSGDRWPPLAGCQLWLLTLKQKRTEEADAVYQTLATRFSFEQLAVLIPSDLRDEILRLYLDDFRYVGTVLRFNPQRMKNIERAAAVDRLLSPNGMGNVFTQLEVSRAYRFAGRMQEALAIAERLAQASGDMTVIRHYSRLLRLTENPQLALSVVNKSIDANITVPNNSRGVGLLTERARVYAALGRWNECENQLDAIIRILHGDRKIRAGMYTYSALMKGFLYERRGATPRAIAVWRDAFIKMKPRIGSTSNATSEVTNAMILGSLCGELSAVDVETFMNKVVDGDSGNSMIQIARRMISTEAYTRAFQEMWLSPRGRRYAEAFAFETLTLRERIYVPLYLGAVEYLRQNAFQNSLVDAQEQLLWDTCEALFNEILTTGNLNTVQFGQLGLSWKGTTNLFGWGGIAPTLDPSLRGPLAYIFAHRFIQRGERQKAEGLFDTAVKDAAKDSVLARLATTDRELLKSSKGKLVFRTDTNQPVEIAVRQGNKQVTTIRVDDTAAVDLPAGKYQLALLSDNDRLRVSSSGVTITVAGQREVAIDTIWKPGPETGSLGGIVPRPALLPGVGRWQVYFRDPEIRADAIACSPSGQLVAVAAQRGQIRIYNHNTISPIHLLVGHTALVTSLAWSPDSRTLASGSYDRTVRLWDIESGTEIATEIGHADAVTTVAWSGDGKHLASADRYNVYFFDAKGERWNFGYSPQAGVFSISWSPDGENFAFAHSNGIGIWGIDHDLGRTSNHLLSPDDGDFRIVAWSPDGKRLVGGTAKNQIRIWNTDQWKLEAEITQHKNRIEGLAWNPTDSNVLASSGAYGAVYVWDVGQSPVAESYRIVTPGNRAVAWSNDGEQLVVSSYEGPVSIWSNKGKTSRVIGNQTRDQSHLDVSRDGTKFVVGGTDGTLRVFDKDGKLGAAIENPATKVTALRLSHDGTHIAFSLSDRSVHIVSSTGESEANLQVEKDPVPLSFAWNRDDQQLAVAYVDKTVRVWDLKTKAVTRTFKTEPAFPRSIDWSVLGLIAVGNSAGRLTIWKEAGGDPTVSIDTGGTGAILSVRFNPSGDQLAVLCPDRSVKIWNADGSAGPEFVGSKNRTMSVAWSPDGQRLASARTNGFIDVWAKDGTRLHELQGHYARANAAVWIGADRILSAGSDVTLRMWDASSAKPVSIIMVLPRHQIAKFSPYGKLEYATDKALNEIIYAVENETGKLDLLSPIDFHQKSGVPFGKVVGTLRVP